MFDIFKLVNKTVHQILGEIINFRNQQVTCYQNFILKIVMQVEEGDHKLLLCNKQID